MSACGACVKGEFTNISHDPWTATGASAPDGVGAVVDGLHVAGASVRVAGLGVAVIETAGIVVVGTIKHGVHALWLISSSNTIGLVDTVAGAGRDKDTIGLLAI